MMRGRKTGPARLPAPTDGEMFGVAVAGWLGAVVYALYRVPVELAALRAGAAALEARDARGVELVGGLLGILFDHGFNVFLLLVFSVGGALFLAYRGLVLASSRPGQTFPEFVKDCFVCGEAFFPPAVVRRFLPDEEVRRREMLAETFLAMACGFFHVERDDASSKLLAVEDVSHKEQGRILVSEAVLRKIAEGILPVLPQYSDAGRVSFRVADQSAALAILSAAFGLGPAPLGIRAGVGMPGLGGGRVVETWPAPRCPTS